MEICLWIISVVICCLWIINVVICCLWIISVVICCLWIISVVIFCLWIISVVICCLWIISVVIFCLWIISVVICCLWIISVVIFCRPWTLACQPTYDCRNGGLHVERAHCHGIFGLSDYYQERIGPTYSQRKNNPRHLHPHPQMQLCPKCGCPEMKCSVSAKPLHDRR
jgi:hypothetical protein